MKKFYETGFILIFTGILLIPLRSLDLNPNTIEESFYLRTRLISMVTNLRLSLGDKVFPKVIVGENGWLVYTGEGDIDDYQNTESFTEEELAGFQKNLDQLATNYRERGITLLVIIPPNKNTIYPERVPGEMPVIGNESRFDQLTAYLQAHGRQQVIDLRPALRAAKLEEDVYYATDTHWNVHGEYLAYSALLNEIQKSHPNLETHPISDFALETREPETLDLTEVIGATLFLESKLSLAPRFDLHTRYKNINLGGRKLMLSYNPDESLPDLVMYYDSFFFNVIPLLGEHFHKGVYIQNYSGGGLWNLSWVDEQEPDVVIIEFSERYVEDLPPFIDPNR